MASSALVDQNKFSVRDVHLKFYGKIMSYSSSVMSKMYVGLEDQTRKLTLYKMKIDK